MFNKVLSELRSHYGRTRFPFQEGYEWWESEYPPDEINDNIDDAKREELEDEWFKNRVPIPVPIPEFDPALFHCAPDQLVDLKGCRLQVIVKIGNIELTPEKPCYDGGSWHVEVSEWKINEGRFHLLTILLREWRTRRSLRQL